MTTNWFPFGNSGKEPVGCLNGAGLRGDGSKTGTVPARGLSQVFAVLTATVSWLANSWDSPPMTLGTVPSLLQSCLN